MEKLRNIRHRLSVSVDKLTPSRRSKSQQRKSVPLVPLSEGDIPGSVGRSRPVDPRPTSAVGLAAYAASGSRPGSYCEADADADAASGEWREAAAAAPEGAAACSAREPEAPPPCAPAAEGRPGKRSTSSAEAGESLMSEVMKEVEKIAEITDGMKSKRLRVECDRAEEDATVSVSDERPLLNASNDGEGQEPRDGRESYDQGLSSASEETLLAEGEVRQRRARGGAAVDRKAVESTSTTLSVASTCRAESLTSGYFSDSDVTLSDVRCDGGHPKSAPGSAVSEGAERRESVETPTKAETQEGSGPATLASVKAESTANDESALASAASEDKTVVTSAFTVVTSQDKTPDQPALASVTSESKTCQSAFTCVTSETKTAIQSVTTSVTSDRVPASSAFTAITSEKKGSVVTAAPETGVKSAPPAKETKVATVTKKESIYSRIMRKRESSKEPIYAKIKPKLTLETSFQPIEPSTAKNTTKASSAGVVKPEPIYSVVKPREPGAPLVPSSPSSAPITPGSPTSSFAPVVGGVPTPPKKVEPIYSKVRPKDSKSSTLPREMPHSKAYKDSGTLTREPKYSKPKSKEHIYAMPLPLTPKEEAAQKRESFYSQTSASSDYGKVTVRVGEISPSRPAVITINNPGYAAPPALPSPTSTTSPASPAAPSPPVSSSTPVWPSSGSAAASPACKPATKTVSISPTAQIRLVDRVECAPKPKSPLETPEPHHPLVASDSSLMESSDTESTGRAKLSRLVEELAQELEAVSRRIGTSADADDLCKKEVLAKLLSTYDVPKNLRRVEEADEDAALEAEQALVPISISMDELRYVDDTEDNAETVYADVPDYSQDEFVIALDDENDPRYASLTRALRQEKLGESPGKISRKTAAVYANALNVVNALRLLINSNSTKAASVINKMGTLARPYAQRMQGSITDTTWIQRVIYHKSGHNGFDELRRYIKSGGEFCKELAVIMNERAELEASYAKGLNKLSGKLLKASKENMGTINHAWQMVGAELEQEGDMHKSIASAITDDVVRPLRHLIETQHKIRKGVESMVDKTTKNLHDWRAAESKAKKQCYGNCRDNEKIQDMMLEARLGRGKTLSDKESMKMEKQRRKAEEAVQKSDLEYYTCCIRAERARLEWESAVYKGSSCFQTLEEERLQALKNLVVKYHKNAKEAAPKMVAIAARLDEPVATCDVEKDIQTVISAKGTGENIPEQMLPDFYAEDMNNIMNRERRREALEKFVQMLRTDLERERRGKQGVENLAKALQETPTFGGEESQQDVNDKLQHDAYNRLQHMKAMLAYLEAARYKVQSSLDELNNRPKMTHPLAKHIEVHRDKQGLTFSILKVPPWVRGNSVDVSPASDSPAGSPNWNDRGTADGTSVQPDSDFEHKSLMPSDTRHSVCSQPVSEEITPKPPVRTKGTAASPVAEKRLTSPNIGSSSPKPFTTQRVFMSAPRYPSLMIIADEFSSQGSDRDYQTAVTEDNVDSSTKDSVYYANPLPSAPAVGRCKALYDYEANMYDELTIKTGDIINIHEKQPDGWWVGELDNLVGIFPATYVEEID